MIAFQAVGMHAVEMLGAGVPSVAIEDFSAHAKALLLAAEYEWTEGLERLVVKPRDPRPAKTREAYLFNELNHARAEVSRLGTELGEQVAEVERMRAYVAMLPASTVQKMADEMRQEAINLRALLASSNHAPGPDPAPHNHGRNVVRTTWHGTTPADSLKLARRLEAWATILGELPTTPPAEDPERERLKAQLEHALKEHGTLEKNHEKAVKYWRDRAVKAEKETPPVLTAPAETPQPVDVETRGREGPAMDLLDILRKMDDPNAMAERPIWVTFIGAWQRCLGLPLYDKAKWTDLNAVADAADHASAEQKLSVLLAIEDLLVQQGAPKSKERFNENDAASLDAILERAMGEPWLADITDPINHPTWTGRFLCGGGGDRRFVAWVMSGPDAKPDDEHTIANVRFIEAARVAVPRLLSALRTEWNENALLRAQGKRSEDEANRNYIDKVRAQEAGKDPPKGPHDWALWIIGAEDRKQLAKGRGPDYDDARTREEWDLCLHKLMRKHGASAENADRFKFWTKVARLAIAALESSARRPVTGPSV
jgi:hypothetical protein